MSNKKFFIILNILNIILLTYLYVCIITTFQWIIDVANTLSLLGAGIYIFFWISKFFLLPLTYYLFKRFCNKDFVINRFFVEFRDNERLQNKALLIAFIYDLIPIIVYTILYMIKNSTFNIFAGFGMFLFYEIVSMGGICVFYIMLIMAAKKDMCN